MLWTLVGEARSHGALDLFVRLAELMRVEARYKGGVYYELCGPP